MATILVKGIPEDLLKELKRLKVELGCKTWAELLAKLVVSKELVLLDKEDLEEIRAGVQGFLKLRNTVSKKWTSPPTVLNEFRKLRSHEGG